MESKKIGYASKRLAIGTVVYMIGNMTSKILQMLILPIITAALSTSEYGYYDLIITTISLVTPLITLQIIEGMFRFMFNATEEDKKGIVSTVTLFLSGSFIILALFFIIARLVVPSIHYPIWIFLNYVSFVFFTYFQKLARCQQKNKVFSIAGVVNTIVMLGFQILFLLVFNMSVDGMLIANAVSYFVASVYICFNISVKEYLEISAFDVKRLKDLLNYSAPLVPNSIGWWVVASSDRFVIAYFLSTSANGIFSIAGKFSQLLTLVTTVFQLAWQESAILEEKSDTRDRFYSKTFNTYMLLLMGAYLVFLPFIRLIIPFLLEESYQIGYLYNPLLLLGAIFSAFSQFYGSSYLVFKKTKGAFTTTVVAAIINIVIGFGLIKYIGLFAPALGTVASFMVQWILRVWQMRDYFKVKIDVKKFLFLIACIIVTTIIYYLNNTILHVISMLIGVIIFLVINREIEISLISKFRSRIKGRKN